MTFQGVLEDRMRIQLRRWLSVRLSCFIKDKSIECVDSDFLALGHQISVVVDVLERLVALVLIQLLSNLVLGVSIAEHLKAFVRLVFGVVRLQTDCLAPLGPKLPVLLLPLVFRLLLVVEVAARRKGLLLVFMRQHSHLSLLDGTRG